MTNVAPLFDMFLFGALPYVALALFVIASVVRYRMMPYTYSSLSSQFLENRQHFWALVPLHYGILTVLAGHLIAFLFPREVLAWNGRPVRLYILEVTALAFGVMTVIGLVAAMVRRHSVPAIARVTTGRDWIVLSLLLLQAASGVMVAVLYPWGASWYAAIAVPYLRSLFTLTPDVTILAAMPWLIKLHIVNAFVLLALAPFSRLVHVLVAPVPYLWRKTQVARWYRRPKVAQ
ncbi:MAG: respiratory nitrate reductase subunit gamma [Acidobacteria bacterium]|nr:respiratory nitrate reductase subunit gamma [Acidobacteriota bacterium]